MKERSEAPTHMATHLKRSTPPESLVWFRPNVGTLKNEPSPHLLLEPPWKSYDVRAAYERALRKHDPLLSPHGLFLSVARNNNHHAKEFLEQFGPLGSEN